MPDAEAIVRALAAIDDPAVYRSEREHVCRLCGANDRFSCSVLQHEETCPWLLAREWVASGPSPEALATVPAENARRARLYDALRDLAYFKGRVALSTSGKDGGSLQVLVGHRIPLTAEVNKYHEGPADEVEAWILEQAEKASKYERPQ